MFKRLISAILFFFCLTISANAQNYPDYTEPYVNDFAAILPQEIEQSIRENLTELRDRKGIEFTVVTIQNMSDYGYSGAIEPFATGLFNYWGIGDASRNDGVMMLVSRYDREMRIEVGSGYGLTKNAPMKRIIERTIIPYFRDENYPKGIERGVEEVIYELTGSYPGEYDASAGQKAFNRAGRFLSWLGDWIYVILAPLMYFPVRAHRRWRRNRPRICPVDGSKMHRLDEVWDDNHLQKGQITEEQLKSVDYDVWQCAQCDHVTVEAYKAWFSQYGACRSCGFKTLQGTTTILDHATTSSTGMKRVDYECHHCNDTYSVKKIIPKKSKSSSSSGGSSFGGGSSSGGGASGSW